MADNDGGSGMPVGSNEQSGPEDPHPDTRMLIYRFIAAGEGKGGLPGPESLEPRAPRHRLPLWRALLTLFSGPQLFGPKLDPTPAREPPPAPPQMTPDEATDHLKRMNGLKGLALSGGGIRSATLSLGVLQAIAKTQKSPGASPGSFGASVLSDFRYLSTVSGGGYIGAFLCSLFLPDRLRERAARGTWKDAATAAADDAVKVLCNEPPGRVRAVPDLIVSGSRAPRKPVGATTKPFIEAPLAWLRDNGRYLTPTGAGDGFYAGSLTVRNLASVHYVIGTALLGAFAVLAILESLAAHLPDGTLGRLCLAGCLVGHCWISPAFLVAILVSAFWTIPAGAAFWIPYPEDDQGHSAAWNGACWGFTVALALFAGVATYSRRWADPELFWHGAPWMYGSIVIILAVAMYLAARGWHRDVSTLRFDLTRSLTLSLQIACAFLALAIVDSASHTFYLWISESATGKTSSIAAPAGIAGGLIWLVRKLALSFGSKKPPSWLKMIPWQILAGAAGLLILALMAIAWGLLAVVLIWQGHSLAVQGAATGLHTAASAASAVAAGASVGTAASSASAAASTSAVASSAPLFVAGAAPSAAAAWIVAGVSVLISFVIGRFPSFINLSSLQSFYSARITRAYLGASNKDRFRAHAKGDRAKASAAEPLPSDQVSLDDFLWNGELATWAPLHLINVTMNNTDAPGEQLVQRDRKGQPIAITPRGFAIDGGEVQQFQTGKPHLEIDRTLNLGQWTGISGAAVSTGLGRQSSLGLSLLLGSANIRLGAWWKSGLGTSAQDFASKASEWAFPTQTYLFGEFTAKFHGLARNYQYLSDGGHFENTGAYELLRPERRVNFILVCDHGADRGYGFDDLANLIRLVRIDMQVELAVEEGVVRDPVLGEWFGVPADFSKNACACMEVDLASCTASVAACQPRHEPVAILLRAMRGPNADTQAWVVVLKPRVRSDSAADVVQYAKTHPTFPQETTLDQFFDEAQWESYRKLAYDNATSLLSKPVWDALEAYIANPLPPSPRGAPQGGAGVGPGGGGQGAPGAVPVVTVGQASIDVDCVTISLSETQFNQTMDYIAKLQTTLLEDLPVPKVLVLKR